MNEKNELLDYWVKLAPKIKEGIPFDVMIGVTDTEKFLLYLPASNLNLGAIDGMLVPEGDAIYLAMKSNKAQMVSVPKEAFGIAFKAKSVPITDEHGKVIGGFGIGISLENQEKLSSVAQHFASTSEEIAASTQELSSSALELANFMEVLRTAQKEMSEQVDKTAKILTFINSVAGKSKILGLNAGIEAARAGEHGRGFTVIAQEIRNLAEDSARSVDEIRGVLSLLNQKVEFIANSVKKATEISHKQSAATGEIFSAINGLVTSAEDIEELSKLL